LGTTPTLSIPVRSDLDWQICRRCVSNIFVSIPVWCDFEKVSGWFAYFLLEVSIPVWCDLEPLYSQAINIDMSRFNSSMVRFGVISPTHQPATLLQFQFQYGAIWSWKLNNLNTGADVVSIPVWCDLE